MTISLLPNVSPDAMDTPDLHKLAQVFLGMALARAEQTGRRDGGAMLDGRGSPEPEGEREVE